MNLARYETSDGSLEQSMSDKREGKIFSITRYEIGGAGVAALIDILAEAISHTPYSLPLRMLEMAVGGAVGYGIRKAKERLEIRRIRKESECNFQQILEERRNHPY